MTDLEASLSGQDRIILQALDALAVALANHNHIWTHKERSLYESAIVKFKAKRADA